MTAVATAPVAVLNASFESLGRTTLKRAVALVMSGRAVIEESSEERILAWENGLMPWPLTIRLLQYLKVPFRVAPEHYSKVGIRRRDNYTCAYCGKAGDTVDHILPQARGGKDEWMNVITACTSCNGKKRDRTPEEAGMPLLFQPSEPMRIYLTGGTRRRKQ